MMNTGAATNPKRAEQVAEKIEQKIIELDWPVGEIIGSEQSLIEEYSASRGVLREAVRLLEHHGTAQMRRGPGGGLVVASPDIRAVRRSAALYLRYWRVDVQGLAEARIALELNCLDLVARRIKDPSVASRLARILDAEIEDSGAVVSAKSLRLFHFALADLANNPAVSLFTEILMELHDEFLAESRPDHSADEVEALSADKSHTAHVAIYKALLDGNLELARSRMSRHLTGVAKYTVGNSEVVA
jgi:DNA-binding FadR family transcriptional regulator